MPYRLIPVIIFVVFLTLFASGAFEDGEVNSYNPGSAFGFDNALNEVDNVLDDALHQDSFDWLNDSVNDVVDDIDKPVEGVVD